MLQRLQKIYNVYQKYEFNVMTVLVYPIWCCTCILGICCSITLPCSMELYISYFNDRWVGIETQILIYSACLSLLSTNLYLIHAAIHLLEYFHSVLSTFYYNSSLLELWIVYYTFKFQSDILYLLKLWYFWFLFISTTIEIYWRYTWFGQTFRSWVTLLNF